MDNNNTCKLRSIIMEYAKFKKVKFEDIDKEKSYINDRKKEIRSLCKCINLDLQRFYIKGRNDYEIPKDVATVISVYLRQDSQRGSTIYKMKKGKYDKILDTDKIIIFSAFMEELKTNVEDDICMQLTIDFLEKEFLGILNQNERRKESIKQVTEGINNKIIRAINAVTGLNDTAGMMLYYHGYIDNECLDGIEYEDSLVKAEEAINKKNDRYFDIAEYESDFNYDDQMELVKCLDKMIHNAVYEWTKVVDISKEIRKEDIYEQCLQNIDDAFVSDIEFSVEDLHNEMIQINDSLLSSEELVQLAVNEYEDNNRRHKDSDHK